MRLPAVVAGLLLTAACAANEAPPSVPVQAGGELVTQVPDSLYDAGRGSSVALDPDGHPVVSHVLLKPVLKEDELPPPVLPGEPQPPAIIVAAQQDGAWIRTSVTEQSSNPAEGKAVGISQGDGTQGPIVNTSLAIDGQGARHVAWSSTRGPFYATDSGGSFGEPERFGSAGTATGVSLTLGSDGSPWVSFSQGGEVRVAHQEGEAWTVETVAGGLAVADEPSRTTAIAMTSDGQPVVAFGRAESTVLARRGGDGSWSLEDVPGPGGFGVSLDLDQEGNPHVAYYGEDGEAFHAHTIGGGPWEVTDLEISATLPSEVWGTDIALDDQGVHYIVVAATGEEGEVQLLNNSGGSFAAQPVPNSEGGATPSIAVSGDGADVALSFFDTENADLEVATAPEEGLHLAFSPPPTTGPAPTAEPPAAECEPEGTSLTIVAQNIAFDQDCLAAPADTAFTIEFDNQDPGTPHNVTIYESSAATADEVLGGAGSAEDFIIGPDQVTYEVEPIPAGEYFFRCDLHPTNMIGTFVSA